MQIDSAVLQPKLYRDIILLTQWVPTISKYSNKLKCNVKLENLYKMCQSIMSCKVYSMKHYEISESKFIYNDNFSTRTEEKNPSSGTPI